MIPGKVGRIQLQDQSAIPFATRGTLWFAMPMAQGDISVSYTHLFGLDLFG